MTRSETVLDDLMTTTDVAAMFGRSKLTIQLWYKNKGLPHVRIPGAGRDTIRFRAREVLKWANRMGKRVHVLTG